MQIVIDIPENVKAKIDDNINACDLDIYDCVMIAVKNGTPLKTGHWINAKAGKLFPSNDFKCSECGNLLDFDGVNCGRGDANFCPNCGAKMESEE